MYHVHEVNRDGWGRIIFSGNTSRELSLEQANEFRRLNGSRPDWTRPAHWPALGVCGMPVARCWRPWRAD